MHNTILIILYIIVISGIAGVPGSSYGDTITLRTRAAVTADQTNITLEQVAELHGDYAESLGDIIIASDIKGRERVTVTISDIRYALKNGGMDKQADRKSSDIKRINWARLAISGSKCSVTRNKSDFEVDSKVAKSATSDVRVKRNDKMQVWASEVYADNNIMAVIAEYMADSLTGGNKNNVYLTFDIADKEILTVPVDNREIEVISQATKHSARVPLVINMYNGDKIDNTYKLTVSVEIRRKVVILKRYMIRGEIFKSGDLAEEVRLIDPNYIDPVISIDDIEGKTARGRLVKGQLLCNKDIKVPVLIKNRSQVVLRSRVGSFIVRMSVIAQETGEVGQIIRVKHIGNNVELRARVEADGELVVIDSID